ncbi:ATP-binding protein [Burkholderia pseudomallei]|uniref:ATP-binding protein n=2 Tax=Burkholderia pseudomallei TaxID=28450 RepID=UPI000C2733F3|nr:ATP-binding protein [Burkholderia pseudomallei]MBF3573432.1 ATP-binding protein [Burkholderia pseudomallei]MBF3660045.1 ATP-binding protein [Burkholderia pseudomallei]MBF3696020.1 ATP-binding protein [Burkholderia pseudomallei]MBF3701971.1 ATP-binding protein [Burkholderia pseudomallei]MBF3721752.1 ATP-binding protein [Burkholderia pseudomallei]
MTRSQSSNPDPSRLGTVEDVNGSSVSVKLSDSTPGGLLFVNGEAYRVGQVGGFVRIPSGYVDLYGVISQVGAGAAPGPPELAPQFGNRWLRVELVGQGRRGTKFERGIAQYPSIGDSVHIVTESDLKTVYAPGDDDGYVAVGRVASAESIRAYVDLNRLVSRHSAVVGSTGSGKSNAVAKLLGAASEPPQFKATRVVLFDLHGEYAKAFGDQARVFRVGANTHAGERELHVPFWALTAEEFISIAMGPVSGTPLTLLQDRLLSAKRASKPGGAPHGLPDLAVTVDTPLPFSVYQVWHDLYSLHCATHTVSSNQNQTEATRSYIEDSAPPQKAVGDADNLVRPRFQPVTTEAGANKVYKGLYSDLPRAHLDLLEGKLRDPRMQFLFNPGEWAASKDGVTQSDLDTLLSSWIGADAPISVFDLSGIPTAIVDDMVGAILRILYDAIFWGRLKQEGGRGRPLLVVLEEAHVYLSAQSKSRAATAARRIAKEGRKYGVGLMLVSQRPSEVDSTILSQCGTVIALRLTNDSDRAQVTSCASDNLKGLFSMLPVLRTGEALIVGEAVNMPIRAIIDRPSEGRRPDSEDPVVVVSKDADGKRVRSGGWTEPALNENYKPLVEAWRKQDPNVGNPVATVDLKT